MSGMVLKPPFFLLPSPPSALFLSIVAVVVPIASCRELAGSCGERVSEALLMLNQSKALGTTATFTCRCI